MESRIIKFLKTFNLICILLVTISALGGCKKKSEIVPPHQHGHEHESVAPEQTPSAEAAVTAAAETEQTVCPITGEKIKKEVFTEYKGKKVYFCCPGCKEKFENDPEKYIDKLPQFEN